MLPVVLAPWQWDISAAAIFKGLLFPAAKPTVVTARLMTHGAVQLPENAELTGITARFENGVLTVRTHATTLCSPSLQLYVVHAPPRHCLCHQHCQPLC